jgi:hypothetical protein
MPLLNRVKVPFSLRGINVFSEAFLLMRGISQWIHTECKAWYADKIAFRVRDRFRYLIFLLEAPSHHRYSA